MGGRVAVVEVEAEQVAAAPPSPEGEELHCSWLSSRSSDGRNLFCCCRIMASFLRASSSSLSFRSISSWAAMI